MDNDSEWLTVQEASQLSNYRADHLRELIRNEKIQAQKFGPIWAVNRQSLLTYVSEAMQSTDRRHGPKSKRRNQDDMV